MLHSVCVTQCARQSLEPLGRKWSFFISAVNRFCDLVQSCGRCLIFISVSSSCHSVLWVIKEAMLFWLSTCPMSSHDHPFLISSWFGRLSVVCLLSVCCLSVVCLLSLSLSLCLYTTRILSQRAERLGKRAINQKVTSLIPGRAN